MNHQCPQCKVDSSLSLSQHDINIDESIEAHVSGLPTSAWPSIQCPNCQTPLIHHLAPIEQSPAELERLAKKERLGDNIQSYSLLPRMFGFLFMFSETYRAQALVVFLIGLMLSAWGMLLSRKASKARAADDDWPRYYIQPNPPQPSEHQHDP